MDEHHIRLQPLLDEKKYIYVAHGEDFDLVPSISTEPTLQFLVVRDENTRALVFLKGEADVLYDSLSLAKTEWLKKQLQSNHVQIISAPGTASSNLAMNLDSPALQNSELRSVIESALPLKLWSDTVFLNWVDLIHPVNSEKMAESHAHPSIPSHLTLRYLTTSSREGQQLAFLTREALEKVGINVEIRIYESSLFYSKIRKREFDLFSARTLPGTKTVLDLPDTGLIPLFTWKHGLILNSRVTPVSNIATLLDDSFRFLADLQLH